MFQFKLPDIGEGIAEAEVLTWHVQPGDTIQKDSPMVEVMTDKATAEITSPVTGTVANIHVPEGGIILVGQVLIEIKNGSSPASSPASPKKKAAKKTVKKVHTPKPVVTVAEHSPAVPAVRHYAKEKNIDLNTLTGTGPNGRIMRSDVDHAIQHPVIPIPDNPKWTRKPLRGMQRKMAEKMVQSTSTIPHFTYSDEIDMTNCEYLRTTWNDDTQDTPLSPLYFTAYCIAQSLAKFPTLTASLDMATQEVVFKNSIHLGIATQTDAGLMVPVVHDADTMTFLELAQAIRLLSERARTKKVTLADLKDGTFSISSLGKLGGIFSTPIINYPESAILVAHRIQVLPRYISGTLTPRHIMTVSISSDHRLVDGYTAACFVAELKHLLELAHFPELQ